MESFTRRVDADDESEDTTTQFSTISSDNGFASSEELRSEISSNNVHDGDDDEGVLSVESTGSVSPPQKRMAMFEGPEILKRLNVFEEVEHGDRVAFECQCKAHPMPVFKWYKDDSELVENDRFKIEDFLETDGTIRLIINSVRKSDEGAYRCKLENQEGVAASTGYLSVTGNSSSPNAVSTPPLLRAITEESNVSQDSDDGATSSSSVTLEKILTGEYDVTTLPYSQYLELLKESGGGSRNPNTDTISGLSTNEKNGGSRTPTEDTPRADDVRNLRPDFAYDTHATAAGDDDVNSFDEQHPITMASDDVETDAEHFVNKPRSEVIFGTPLLTDSQTVFFIEGSRRGVEVGGTDESSRDSDDRNLEEMSKEEGDAEFSLGGTRCGDTVSTTGFEADVDYESRVHGESSKALLLHNNSPGDFREEGDADSLDESRMKETVIAGRIGMPSDWEFAHYTAEADEVEEESPNSVPDEADAIPRLAVETLGSRYMEEEEVAVPEAETGASSTLDGESAVPEAENLESREVLPREEELHRDYLLGGNEEEAGDKERIFAGEGKDEVGVVPENSDDVASSSFLVVESTPILAAEEDVTRLDEADVEDDFHFSPSDPQMLPEGSTSDVKEEAAQESKPEDQPEKQGAAKWMPEMTSISNVVSGVSTLINWNAGSAPPEEDVVVEAHKPEVAGSDGDEVVPPTTESTGFHFASLMSDLRPSAAAAVISDWIPNVTSYLPSLSPDTLTNDGKPATDVDEVVTEFVEPDAADEELRSAIEWCIDWFRYPSIFYVLLVLTMTIVASATQMNPALVVLVVALCSIVGFRLFPVQK